MQQFPDIARHDKHEKRQLLNYSPDWLTIYWPGVAQFQSEADKITLQEGGRAWELEIASESKCYRIWRCEGVSLKCIREELTDDERSKLSPHGVELQIQGAAWSQGTDWRELKSSCESLLCLPGGSAICGRVDLAADICMPQSDYARLVCGGALPAVKELWVSRARKSRAQFGAAIVGSDNTTLYLGSRGGMQLVIYRKDVEFEGNTGAMLKQLWASNGWKDDGRPVVRVEIRLSREWIREHELDGHKGKVVKPELVISRAGALWRIATSHSFRLVKKNGDSNKRRRPTSTIWAFCQDAWNGYNGACELAACEQVPDVNLLIETTGKRIEDLKLALGKDFEKVLVEILNSSESLQDYSKNRSRWRKWKR